MNMTVRTGLTVALSSLLACAAWEAPARAEEAAPASGAEELTRALQKKGVLSESEAQGVLQRLAVEREAAARGTALYLKGMSLQFTGLGQFRFTYDEGAHKVANGTTPSFRINNARFGFMGRITSTVDYYALFAFERPTSTTTDKTNGALYDVKLSYTPMPGLSITAGQFVMPVSAEANEPTAKLDLPDRYYATGRILNPSANHDIGIAAHGVLFDRRLEYAAGMFNGNGPNVTANNDDHFLYAARLGGVPLAWDMMGRKAELYVGADAMWERTPADASPLRTDANAVFTEDYDRTVYGYDGQLRWRGFRVKGEYLGAQLRGRNGDPIVHADGWYAQLSQLVGSLEPLVRYQAYDPDWHSAPSRAIRWTTLALNWYIRDNYAKVQSSYTLKRESSAGYPNDEFVTQLQLFF